MSVASVTSHDAGEPIKFSGRVSDYTGFLDKVMPETGVSTRKGGF